MSDAKVFKEASRGVQSRAHSSVVMVVRHVVHSVVVACLYRVVAAHPFARHVFALVFIVAAM